jgi:putative ATP-dependent endonuclease of OLD family
MRIARIQIRNFRSLEQLDLHLEDVTVLVGANGTGKSSVLHALDWFFSGMPLDEADVTGKDQERTTSVAVTFTGCGAPDRAALGNYVVGDDATFERSWSRDSGDKLTGHPLAFPAFEEVRATSRAQEKIEAYKRLRERRSDLELPNAVSGAAVDREMTAWEEQHPDRLKQASISATHLFGWAGRARLAGRFDCVLVPAVLDVERETRDARGTLLRQLIERGGELPADVSERLQALAEETRKKVDEIMTKEGRTALEDLERAVTLELQRLVPDAGVRLWPTPSALDLSPSNVELRIADAGFETDVGRQGHGVQRSLLMALIRQLSASPREAGNEAPGLLLMIEEPELYQHPLQARHLAATLRQLGNSSGAPIQVLYATHSEHFVDTAHFESLRRFSKRATAGYPVSRATAATLDGVSARLKGLIASSEIRSRIRITMRRRLDEAVFARSAVVVEGPTDAALLAGLAERRGGFDAAGIAVVIGWGKTNLLLPWAILEELGVPTFLVFDGDANIRDRLIAAGKDEAAVTVEMERARENNRLILEALGVTPQDWPESQATGRFAVFKDEIEVELDGWDGWKDALAQARSSLEEFREKSDDAYRRAAESLGTQPPAVFSECLDAIFRLPGG